MAAARPEILTLSPDEISRFLMRTRRQRDVAAWEVRLDGHLREILERANEFVPSAAGSILLDDPRAKLAGTQVNRLTFIAVFGATAAKLLGQRIPATRGIAGRIYSTGAPHVSPDLSSDPYFTGEIDQESGFTSRSIIGVPVIVGESICGVLELVNRLDGQPYEPRDLNLLRIFAGYISSSIQNALDAIRARELARRDDLTGLFNDRFLHSRLHEEIERAENDGTDLALLFLDLDDFKRINDMHGHLAGSRTLTELGGMLVNVAPAGAVCARYGGDEFVIILPGADAARAVMTAEEVRQRIAAHTFLAAPTAEGRLPLRLRNISASVGVSSYHEHVASRGEAERRENALLRLADTAMYDAKHRGKNCVVVAEPE
ncbi:MAG: sensor domain-containing diguanylate cyclase [Deltaproteobacteria bacterium]|nr:sensor domain-containing diguanylate cyclase [Deltaproteobacteria bacterium]